MSPDSVDLQFALRGASVPLDYADQLWQAVHAVLPWLADEPLAGIHPLYGLSPGQGCWYLSRRSHLNLRLPASRVGAAEALVGARLKLSGADVEVGKATVRSLTPAPVLYACFVTFGLAALTDEMPAEAAFFAACQQELAGLGLVPRAMICGKRQAARTAAGVLHGFSLMVSGLDAEAARCLQVQGLGAERKRGCGIFVPHKSSPADTVMER